MLRCSGHGRYASLLLLVLGCLPARERQVKPEPLDAQTPMLHVRWLRGEHYVLTGSIVDGPPDATIRTASPLASPSGPITHLTDIAELPPGNERTFTLLPPSGRAACVHESAERVALSSRTATAGHPTPPPSTSGGAEAFLVRSTCVTAELALEGRHPQMRLVGLIQSHQVSIDDAPLPSDVDDVFGPTDVARLLASPKGSTLSLETPVGNADGLRVSTLRVPGKRPARRIRRGHQLLAKPDGRPTAFLLDDDGGAFALMRGDGLLPL